MNAGADLMLTGTLETRYSLLTLRLADALAINIVGTGVLSDALPMLTGQIGELVESQIVTVQATVADGISTLTDGFSTAVDDGSGSLRVVVSAISGISADLLPRGALLQLTGVVGQRDTSGTGAAGYRLHLRSAADVVALATPSPSATPSPAPTPTATPAPTPPATSQPTPTPTALPTATPSPTPVATAAILTIASARALAVGELATIQGTVTVDQHISRLITHRRPGRHWRDLRQPAIGCPSLGTRRHRACHRHVGRADRQCRVAACRWQPGRGSWGAQAMPAATNYSTPRSARPTRACWRRSPAL